MQKIKAIREALNLKQSEFSAALDISQTYLSAIETGRRQFTSKLANILFKKFNVSPEWLYNDNGNIFNSTMGNTNGVNDGVNSGKPGQNLEYTGFKDSPNVAKVKLFWKQVALYDTEFDESFEDYSSLELLLTDGIGACFTKPNEIINEVFADIQNADYNDIKKEDIVNQFIKRLSFLKDNRELFNEISKSVKKLIAFSDVLQNTSLNEVKTDKKK